MTYKYNKTLDAFIRHSKTLRDGGIDFNSALTGRKEKEIE
tara:strand:- start:316 stop:435 length:120 start_codon:yes stop_codon:yes gene_type:complete